MQDDQKQAEDTVQDTTTQQPTDEAQVKAGESETVEDQDPGEEGPAELGEETEDEDFSEDEDED